MNRIKRKTDKGFYLNTLAICILMVNAPAYALQAMDDNDLRHVNGQDGVHISTTYKEANIDQLYWEDNAGRGSPSATNSTLKAVANGVKIQQSNASSKGLGTEYKINAGSNTSGSTTKTGIDFDITTNPSLITVDSFNICDTEAAPRCNSSIGNLAIQTSSDIGINFITSDGLFSKTSQSTLKLGIGNANIYLGQTDVKNQLNQLILKNFNFNFLGRGVMFVEKSEGFKLQTNAVGTTDAVLTDTSHTPSATRGYVDFSRVPDKGNVIAGTYKDDGVASNAGLNLEFMINGNVPQNTSTNPTAAYAINQVTKSPENATGLIRVGATGRMVNGILQLRGVDSSGKNSPDYTGSNYGRADNTNIAGTATSASGSTTTNNIMGSSGIGFRLKADFTTKDDPMLQATNGATQGESTKLEIGGAGLNTYGFEFGNLTGLKANTRGTFDSGNVYLNLADTKTVALPANYVFQTARFGDGTFLSLAKDYTQTIHNLTENPYSLLVSVRGAEFQAISRQGRFTNSARTNASMPQIAEHNDNKWGLALPFYNLNANLAMYGTNVDAKDVYYYTTAGKRTQLNTSGSTPRLGFSLAMNTFGIDRKTSDNSYTPIGDKTTSILVIDGGDRGDGKSTDYYMGLRNIDMLLKGNGSIGVENGSFNVSLKNMLIVMAAEVAAGYLPGTTYKTCITNPNAAACGTRNSSPDNNFALADDVLMGIKLRLGGDMDFSLIPNSEYKADGSGNRLSIVGDLTLDKNAQNTIQISDPVDKSTIGLDNLQGKIAFNNAIVIQPNTSSNNEGVVNFNASLTFNPDKDPAGVFRARDINLYPPNTGNGARLGEIAITGGRLTSELGIMPRNTPFN